MFRRNGMKPAKDPTIHRSATDQGIHAEMLRLIAKAIELNDPQLLRDTAERLEKIGKD